MKIPILICYSIQRNLAQRRSVTKPAFEIVEFDISEATRDQAPIAIAWNDKPGSVNQARWGPFPEGGNTHTRWFCGHHWRPLLDAPFTGQSADCQVVTADYLASLARSKTPYTPCLGNNYLNAPKPPRDLPEECPDEALNSVVGSSRDVAIALCHKALMHMLVVDGEVYERCHEPMLVTHEERHPDTGDLISPTVLRVITDEQDIGRKRFRSPDDVNPVTAFEGVASLKGLFDHPRIIEADAVRRPEIFVWDSINEDAHLNVIADVKLQAFLAHISSCPIGRLSLDALEAVAAIRRAHALPFGEDRFDALERAIGLLPPRWMEDYDGMESLIALAEVIGSRTLEVPVTDFAPGSPPRNGL